ncbi:MAG: isoprenyl transferase [Candidatus Firestonebacteria bacterium]|nr:isoprenyl transferase [Candidatus Firestonebacteria bacterium]
MFSPNNESETNLRKKLDLDKLPAHVAVIMDGNGRWAQKKHKLRIFGHREGINRVREIVRCSGNIGIKYLTLYAFSVENWKRPRKEVNALMGLLKEFLRKEVDDLNKNNVTIRYIGRTNELPESALLEMAKAEKILHNNTGLVLTLALNYGGRAEIIDAVRKIADDIKKDKLSPENLNEEIFSKYLYTSLYPDPDLLIRTSGEIRISNYLLWQIAYSEIYITSTLWPDFKEKEYLEAILDYQKRNRRFGAVG